MKAKPCPNKTNVNHYFNAGKTFNLIEMRFLLILFFGAILLYSTSSCVSHKRLVNYREDFPDSTRFAIVKLPDIKIQPNDVLGIRVFSSAIELAVPFNLNSEQQSASQVSIETIQLTGYLVNQEGKIDFPVLGTLKLDGLGISQAKDSLVERLKHYIKDPVVNMRLLNFRVTVSGEVRNPGGFNILNERISLLDALALAGDLTDYADRKSILLVREKGGIRSLNQIDLQSAAFFQSEYYYLMQNDLIYVKPLKAKAGAVQDQTSKMVPILTAAATLAAVLIALFKN
jgi:polysaccharide export outer membrane protein